MLHLCIAIYIYTYIHMCIYNYSEKYLPEWSEWSFTKWWHLLDPRTRPTWWAAVLAPSHCAVSLVSWPVVKKHRGPNVNRWVLIHQNIGVQFFIFGIYDNIIYMIYIYIILYYIILYIYLCVCTLCIYIYTCIELSPEMGTSECWRAVSGKTCNKYHLCNNLWFWLVKPMDQASCTMAQQKTCHIYRDWPYSWKDLVLEFKYFWGIPL
jgi:hypothetical protein